VKTTCKRYFVDPNLLNSGVPIEALEKSEEIELSHAYEALLSPHEIGAKTNKETARKWIEAISTPSKAARGSGRQ
jgi:hypothetical protein